VSTRQEMADYIAKMRARELEDAVKVIRHLRLDFPGASRAAVCRVLLGAADNLKYPPNVKTVH